MERIYDRVAKLWADMLRNPRFDNGDSSANGAMALGLASVGNTRRQNDAEFSAKVDRFETILADRLKFLAAHDGEEMPESEWEVYSHITFKKYHKVTHLDCDYDPDRTLEWAALQAGFANVAKTLFPWKTNMSFYDSLGAIALSAGYAAEDVYHYPLSDGKWLLCNLRGNDMPSIIAAVEAGTLTIGKIEQ